MTAIHVGATSFFDYVMTDHPAWRTREGLRSRAFPTPNGAPAIVTVMADAEVTQCVDAPSPDCFALGGDAKKVHGRTQLDEMGRVGRYRNPSLWDAIGTAIIRQVIRAGQARKMYLALCETAGEPAKDHTGFTHWLFPSAERVLELEDDEFARLGMAFKRKGLRSAASTYLQRRSAWESASPAELASLLQEVAYVGPWTAAAAVADYTNDWTLYAYDDLAVRTWARQALPDVAWADDESTFGQQWRQISGDQLGNATLLTLAWGERHGDRRRAGGNTRRS